MKKVQRSNAEFEKFVRNSYEQSNALLVERIKELKDQDKQDEYIKETYEPYVHEFMEWEEGQCNSNYKLGKTVGRFQGAVACIGGTGFGLLIWKIFDKFFKKK